MFLQPGQQVLQNLAAIDLIEHLMPPAGVQLHGYIPAPGAAEHLLHLPHAFAHGPHRVPVPGKEIDRRLRVQFS